MDWDWEHFLKSIVWEEGLKVELEPHSPRYAVTIICTELGQTVGEFANGPRRYFALTAIVRKNKTRIYDGGCVVPVLPDERLLMVINQRPGVDFFQRFPRVFQRSSGSIVDLGRYGSLEFPGGSIDQDEKSITIGVLRELKEETGIRGQQALLIRRVPPIYPMGAEVVGRMHFSVVFLVDAAFPNFVDTDGGLRVFALTAPEVEANIRAGNIDSGHAALLGWYFYKEIDEARKAGRIHVLEQAGYCSAEEVTVR